MSDTPAPDTHLQAAIDEEQVLLERAVQQARIQHLMARAVNLNAQARRTAADANPPDQEE